MSSKPYRNAKAKMKASMSSVSASAGWSTNNISPPDLFGPMMAQEIFDFEDYYGEDCDVDDGDDDGEKLVINDDYQNWWQPELPLQNVRELENDLRRQIGQFRKAYAKLMPYALQWHYLLEECEDDAMVEKLFKDLQMIRKIKGSDKV